MVPKIRNARSGQVEFFLKEEGGDVNIMAIGADGEEWYVLGITPDGVRFWTAIESSSGIPIDKKGRIKVVNVVE